MESQKKPKGEASSPPLSNSEEMINRSMQEIARQVGMERERAERPAWPRLSDPTDRNLGTQMMSLEEQRMIVVEALERHNYLNDNDERRYLPIESIGDHLWFSGENPGASPMNVSIRVRSSSFDRPAVGRLPRLNRRYRRHHRNHVDHQFIEAQLNSESLRMLHRHLYNGGALLNRMRDLRLRQDGLIENLRNSANRNNPSDATQRAQQQEQQQQPQESPRPNNE